MSWDIFVQDLPPDAESVADIPSDYQPKSLGPRDALIAKIREIVPSADFSDPSWGHIEGERFSIEVNLGQASVVDSFAFHVRGGEEAVGAVPVRPQAQPGAVRHACASGSVGHLRAFEQVAHRQHVEAGSSVRRGSLSESAHHVFVLRGQQAAGGVDEAAAGLQEARRRSEDASLLLLHLLDRLGRLAPLEVGVAPERAQPRARRIDEHAVDLAREALDALVALVRDLHRMNVRQAAARQARLQRVEAMAGDVEGVQAPRAAHHRAQRQRLAAGAGAEVHHHLAALGIRQQRQQLAALVLHLHPTVDEGLAAVERRLALHAQAPR